MSVELSDVFTGVLLVHFEESVSPHSVCFHSNHCSADPFFRRGATHVYSWTDKSKISPCVTRGACWRVRVVRRVAARLQRGTRNPTARARPSLAGARLLLAPHSGFIELVMN